MTFPGTVRASKGSYSGRLEGSRVPWATSWTKAIQTNECTN